MKIEYIRLREINMRLKSPFETNFGVTENRKILLVEVKADGLSGWGGVITDEPISCPRIPLTNPGNSVAATRFFPISEGAIKSEMMCQAVSVVSEL
jgi:hypothetical protein